MESSPTFSIKSQERFQSMTKAAGLSLDELLKVAMDETLT